jgi:hypothetical protein
MNIALERTRTPCVVTSLPSDASEDILCYIKKIEKCERENEICWQGEKEKRKEKRNEKRNEEAKRGSETRKRNEEAKRGSETRKRNEEAK